MQLVKAIVHQARRSHQDPAVAFAGGVASFGSLMGSTAAAVEVLRSIGIAPGSLVVLDIRNPIHHTAMIYALALLGIRSASVGSTQVTRSGPRPDLFLTDRDDVPDPGLPARKVDPRWFAFDQAAPVDFSALAALPGFPNPDDVVRYVYSSGTTGRPKCVALTNRSLEARIAHLHFSMHQRTLQGAALNMIGFSTIAGIMAPMIAHTNGALLCFSSNYAEALNLVRLFNVTAIAGAVVQLQGLLKALGDAAPPPSLGAIAISGSKISIRMLTEIRARLSSYVMGGYGSTEIGSLTSATAADLERHEGAVGYLLPWVEMQIVDDLGEPVPAGTEGVIRARSPELAFYVDAQGKPEETTRDGWFYPGDYGRIEPDGLVVITGRTSEVINRGGVIVAPDFIEEVLRLDPAVSDVAVVGVPTESGIDQIWAAVVSPAPVDLTAVLAAARLQLNERAPDRLFQVEALPRAESGKVKRNALREDLLRRFQS